MAKDAAERLREHVTAAAAADLRRARNRKRMARIRSKSKETRDAVNTAAAADHRRANVADINVVRERAETDSKPTTYAPTMATTKTMTTGMTGEHGKHGSPRERRQQCRGGLDGGHDEDVLSAQSRTKMTRENTNCSRTSVVSEESGKEGMRGAVGGGGGGGVGEKEESGLKAIIRRNGGGQLSTRIIAVSVTYRGQANDQCIVPPPLDVSSESVHCNALTQSSTVSYAFSCHTIDTCGKEQDVESASALPPPHSHPWAPSPSSYPWSSSSYPSSHVDSAVYGSCDDVSSRYRKVDRIGEGTYGVVLSRYPPPPRSVQELNASDGQY